MTKFYNKIYRYLANRYIYVLYVGQCLQSFPPFSSPECTLHTRMIEVAESNLSCTKLTPGTSFLLKYCKLMALAMLLWSPWQSLYGSA